MKKTALIALSLSLLIVTAFSVSPSPAADGKALYESMHCNTCHKPDKSTPAGKSAAEIAQAYKNPDALVKFFSGQAGPVLQPNLPPTMQKQMDKLKALSNEDKKALADYVASIK